MKVPDELVQIAMDAAVDGHVEDGQEIPGDEIDFDAALEAVLLKVRERLISDEAMNAAHQALRAENAGRYTEASIEAAFDHAFPEG